MSRRLRTLPLLLLGLATGLTTGCLRPRPTTVPIPVLRFAGAAPPGQSTAGNRCLVVFLPGRRDRPEDFEREGFVRLLQASGARCDALAVDAHIGYYVDRSIVDRLHADVIGPARRQGYGPIWLVGISMGGLGSLLYLQHHPEEVAGAIVLAPYLGEKEVLDEISAAGGLARWQPAPHFGADDFQQEIWSFLHDRYAVAQASGQPSDQTSGRPAADQGVKPLFLGYGTGDRLAPAAILLAAVLPPERVTTTPGGHDWPPWRALWKELLARGALPGSR